MSEKRKDKKGRVLKAGESQRKDGTYMYRFSDVRKKQRCVYAQTLEALREKESKIQHDIDDGIDYTAGEITVLELVEKYIEYKQYSRNKTQQGYKFVMKLLGKYDFGYRQIKNVKPSDCKTLFIQLYNDGKGYNTIVKVQSVIKPAFGMAVMDDILRKNPFSFSVQSVIPNNVTKKDALSEEEVVAFLTYVQSSTCAKKHYNEIVILLGTGLRASELCGLTKSDIDFQNRRIHVERQLLRDEHGEYYINAPKTNNGERYIPMDNNVYRAFQNVISTRSHPKTEYVIGGCAGFLFLDRSGKPKTVRHLDNAFRSIVKSYNENHDDKLTVTPHILRHTFCTRLTNFGMDPKCIQYIMGHGDLSITMGTYAHSSYDVAEKAFKKMTADV